jgi:HEAT repeat protein
MSATTRWVGILGVGIVVLGSAAYLNFRLLPAAELSNSVPSLVAGLKSSDSDTRVASASRLAEEARGDDRAEDALIAALADPSEKVRFAVADTLAKRASPKSAKPLAEALKDKSSSVRGTSAYALGKMKDLDSSLVASLLSAFSDSDPYVRTCVLEAMETRARTAENVDDPRVAALEPLALAGMSDTAPKVRRAATLALSSPPKGKIVEADKVVLAMSTGTEDADFRARMFAVMGLPGVLKIVGSKIDQSTILTMSEKVPSLIQGVIEGDRDTRPMFQAAIVTVGSAARTAKIHANEGTAGKILGALTTGLAVPGKDVRPVILASLPALYTLTGSNAKFIKESLQTALADPVTHAAAVNTSRDFLNLFESTDEEAASLAMDLLRPTLKDEDPLVRGVAYTSLWQSPLAKKVGGEPLRTELRGMTKNYIESLSNPNPIVREVAAWSLTWTDPEDADAALVALEAAKEKASKIRVDSFIEILKTDLLKEADAARAAIEAAKDDQEKVLIEQVNKAEASLKATKPESQAIAAFAAVKANTKEKPVTNRINEAITKLKSAKSNPAAWPDPSWKPFRNAGPGARRG